jgi:hypothetical protein
MNFRIIDRGFQISDKINYIMNNLVFVLENKTFFGVSGDT